MVKIDTLRSSQISFTNGIYTCTNAKECLTNAVAHFSNALRRMKQQHDACVLYAYTVLPVFLFFLYLPAPAQSANSHSNFAYCPHLRMLVNLYKRLTVTTNALLLIRIACNCLRICCEYAFLTEFRNLFLIFAIPHERSECLRIRTNVWR